MSAPAVASGDRSPWLFGAAPDLLFGCGLLYLLIFAALAFVGPDVRALQPLVVFPLLILALSAPHYGATVLRVYEHRRDRRAYAIFSVWATLLVVAWFAAGVAEHRVGSWLVTLFLTWSPWHYTGQNYGIAVMFLRRGGVALDPTTKRALYASFVTSFLLTATVLHGSAGLIGYDDVNATGGGRAVQFIPLGIPESVTSVAVPLIAATWLAATLVAGVRLSRRGPLRSLAPAAWLVLTQAVWFAIPFLLRHFDRAPLEVLDFDLRTYYFTWVALAHSLQYLWVTTYYARAGSDWRGPGRYYLKTLLAGKALFVLPVVACAPFGALSYDNGLALLVSSAVNVHHFILDGAIWKLRNTRVARVLIRSSSDEREKIGEPRSRWREPVWAVAAAGLAASAFVMWTDLVTIPRGLRAGDNASVAVALDRLARLGFDHEKTRAQLASNLLELGRVDAAAAQARRSLELQESAEGWRLLGDAQLRSRQHEAALESYERALALEPDSLLLLLRLAQANAASGHPDRARELLDRAGTRVAAGDAAMRATIADLQARLAARPVR